MDVFGGYDDDWRGRGVVLAMAIMALVGWPTETRALPAGASAAVYAENLSYPTAFSVAENGDILIAEKLGAIRVVRNGRLLEAPVAELRVAPQNEAGLIGIEPMPDYPSSGEFLALYTPKQDLAHIYVSKLKLQDDAAVIVEQKWLEFPSRPRTDRHYGGGMAFGPQEMLYIGLGELSQAGRAQDTDNVSGSIVRYDAQGNVPEDNPIDGSPIYAYGLRNPFGVTAASDGTVWTSVNGADIADEINRVEKGDNFGWPRIRGVCDNYPKNEPCSQTDQYTAPAYEFTTIVGPTGLVEYEGEMFPKLQGDLLVAGWHSRWIHHFEVGDDERLTQQPPLFRLNGWEEGGGRSTASFTDVTVGPNGAIFVLESGRSAGRVVRIAPDDKIDEEDELGGEPNPVDSNSEVQVERGCGGCSTAAPLPMSLAYMLLLVGGGLLWRRGINIRGR